MELSCFSKSVNIFTNSDLDIDSHGHGLPLSNCNFPLFQIHIKNGKFAFPFFSVKIDG